MSGGELKEVIDGNYTEKDYQIDTAKSYATAAALSVVDEENVFAIREFIKKMGLEILTLFDDFWTQGDPNRIQILEDIRAAGLIWRKK